MFWQRQALFCGRERSCTGIDHQPITFINFSQSPSSCSCSLRGRYSLTIPWTLITCYSNFLSRFSLSGVLMISVHHGIDADLTAHSGYLTHFFATAAALYVRQQWMNMSCISVWYIFRSVEILILASPGLVWCSSIASTANRATFRKPLFPFRSF